MGIFVHILSSRDIMIILSCNGIFKSFGINLILENIGFSINAGERIGLVGANGSGKTTLFKILTGQYAFDSGELYLSKDVTLGYMEQSSMSESGLTVYEETLLVFDQLIKMEDELRRLEHQISTEGSSSTSTILDRLMNQYAHKSEQFENLNGYGYKSEIRGVLKGLGFSEEEFAQPMVELSGGQKTRVSLAKLLLKKPDILLLDEPTNHLDFEAIEWLEGFLKSYQGTVLIISHDRYFLDQIVGKIYDLENRKLVQYNGSYSNFVSKKIILFDQKLKEYTEQQKEIDKQQELIRRFKQHGTEKLAKRAKSREKLLAHMDVIDKPMKFNKRAKIKFETQIKSGDDVLDVEGLCKSFSTNLLFKDIDFKLYRGERVGLIGPNGIGKSTLLKLILGSQSADSGTINVGQNVHISYFDQEQALLNLNNTVIDEIWQENINFTHTEVRSLLGSFLFTGDEVFKNIANLSGGEKTRISLLKLILSKSNLLLMDEPTNHLDIASKEVLEDALVNYDGTLFVISHDRYFLNKVATKILSLSKEGMKEYLGNYDYYYEKKKEAEQLKVEEPLQLKTKTQLKDQKRKEKDRLEEARKHKLQQKDIEKQISELEEKLQNLHYLMCQEEIYSNPEKSKQVYEKTNLHKLELEELYVQWEDTM